MSTLHPSLKPELLHCPLEPYRNRYSEHLKHWETRAFESLFNTVPVVPANQEAVTVLNMTNGTVLDRVQRPQWALSQVQELLKVRSVGQSVYLSDFFHPGLEALAYSRKKFRLFSFCWAQSFDQYDFTVPMMDWMRPWELAAFQIYEKVFVACPLLKELIVTAFPAMEPKIKVVGLPFNSQMVAASFNPADATSEEFDAVYSSRWDVEKNPGFFIDLVESCPDLSFVVCTGMDDLQGSDARSIRRALTLESQGRLTIRRELTKSKYYGILMASKVQLNTSLQDWVSFTLLEALTFGCIPLYPNHRSFPAVLNYDNRVLYRPHDLSDADAHLRGLLSYTGPRGYEFSADILAEHDQALYHIAKEMF